MEKKERLNRWLGRSRNQENGKSTENLPIGLVIVLPVGFVHWKSFTTVLTKTFW